jgi:carboxyl-terminal processing protease
MEKNPKHHYLIPLGLAVAMAIGLGLGYMLTPHTNYVSAEKKGEKYQKIQDILEVLDKRYVDPVDGESLFEKTLGDMLHKLDPHSNYIAAKDMKSARENIDGAFGGVGVRFFILKDTVCITNVIKGSPSERAGLLAGDKILKIDGEKVAGVKIENDEIMSYLKGDPNTEVKATVLRNKEELKVKIVRGVIPIYSVTSHFMLNEETGFIRIEQFSVNTANEFKQAALQLMQEGMNKLVLDLRNNGGGVLSAAVDIADEFLPAGLVILQTKGSNTKNQQFRARDGGLLERMEVAVLINQYSASASEILAGALQDNDRGVIYGRRSFGKGLVQGDFLLRDGSNLRLTISRYYTPSGRCIQKPYNGSMDDYYSDSYNRFDNGELFKPDSSIFVDSLKYKTKNGRIVYGGGGIMPDVFIPYDTTDFTEYFSRLRFTRAFQDFSFQYVSDKRNTWINMQAFKADLEVNYKMVKKFTKFAELEHEVPVSYKELLKNQKIIAKHLKAEIARQLWTEQGYHYIMSTYDPEVIEVLTNWIKL